MNNDPSDNMYNLNNPIPAKSPAKSPAPSNYDRKDSFNPLEDTDFHHIGGFINFFKKQAKHGKILILKL